MPGWYIHMDAARKAIDGLDSNVSAKQFFAANGMSASAIAMVAHQNPAYVALGAIGPDIFFLLPDFTGTKGKVLWNMANWVMELYKIWDEHFLGPYESAMLPIEDNLQDELNAFTGGLKDQIESIFARGFAILKDGIADLILHQYDFFGLLSSGVPSGVDEKTFFWSDMLHYRETYRFATVLWQRANDPLLCPDAGQRARFQAFALGWMTHLATDVTGHAFVNQKVGGPYRLHWQRHHLVENHMDALVFQHERGGEPIYNQLANACLHHWIAFKPDGSSFADMFQPQPGQNYPTGDHAQDINQRHAVWDVDSDMPGDLAQFISDTLKIVFDFKAPADPNGMAACCPVIISDLSHRVPPLPFEAAGYPLKDDIAGAYFYLFKYIKAATTDYYKIRRPDPPDVVVVPSFPQPPGSGDSDAAPSGSDGGSFWDDALDALLSLFAWAAYLAEVAAWPAAVIAGIAGGAATYGPRYILYETMELPLYNLWLAVHNFLAMTGYVMPMPGEVNSGLNTLGRSTATDWQSIIVALADADGGLGGQANSSDPSGSRFSPFPRDVVMDPPSVVTSAIGSVISLIGGSPPVPVNGEIPSEFTRPWRYPEFDNQGNPIFVELPNTVAGPYDNGMDATVLLGGMPGSNSMRQSLEGVQSEGQTLELTHVMLRSQQHLGDPLDYSAYVIAQLTRTTTDPAKVANFNLDSDRGYGYLTWDWVRSRSGLSQPAAYSSVPSSNVIPGHVYKTPIKPGYGWSPTDQIAGATGTPFNPVSGPQAGNDTVTIRYIHKQPIVQ